MKIIDGLIYQLRIRNFIQLDIKLQGIYLFYRPDSANADLAVLFTAPSGEELSVSEYEQILNNIKKKFIENGFVIRDFISLILTWEPDKAKQFCLDQDNHWIMDLAQRRLIIYENQIPDYMGLKKELTKLLEMDNLDDQIYMKTGKEGVLRGIRHNGWTTLLNTSLIIINIIIYMAVYYTDLFGVTEEIIEAGALNWRVVKENGNFYRLITSMFLHSDLEHLLNNMLVLFFVGENLEKAVGKVRYLLIYFGTGIVAGITSISYNMIKDQNVYSIGASGAIFGIVGAMIYVIIINKGRLEGSSGRQLALFTIFSLYGGIASTDIDNAAHIGGFLGGLLLAALLYRRQRKRETIPG